jgi:murein DD-endopeptidase MepM/ murein hydrolase activator NlpD
VFKDIKKFFSDLFKGLKSKQIAKFTPIIAIVCLLAILIPTLIAVWQVYFKKDEALVGSDEVSVSLYDAKGALLSESSVAESNLNVSPLVDVFYNLYLSKAITEVAPDLTDKKPNYKVNLSYGDSKAHFSCYFTESAESSYILDADGRFYTIDASYYGRFLDMEYSDAVYSSATPPTLMTKDGETVIPYSASWSYKKLDGTVKSSESLTTSVARHTYSASGSIGLNFSKAPDFCAVIVTDTLGNEIYHGDLDGLSSVTANVGEHLRFSVEAEWNNRKDADSFGTIKYNFELLFKNLATFSISSSEAHPGSYLIISAFDIEDGTSPIYTPDTSIENASNIFNYTGDATASAYFSYIDALDFLEYFKPSFFKDGSALKAILPIPYNTPEGDFIFTLSSGVATSTYKVQITSGNGSDIIPLKSSDESVVAAISKKAMDEVLDLADALSRSSQGAPIFRGEFLSPLSQNYTRVYSYGDGFTLEDEPLEKLSALGNAYLSSTSEGRRVCASNIGVVIKTGQTSHLGSFVVVDHGGGILTWYCNLSDFNVREGDVVAKGEIIGKSGELMLVDGDGFLLLFSVKGTFVDPSLILGKEIYVQ